METLQTYVKKLRLGASIVENAQTLECTDKIEYLTKLFQMEVDHRELKRRERYIAQAGFGQIKTFDTYNFEEIEIPGRLSIEDIKSARFIERKENLILYGGVGAGKTHMAIAAGVNACNRGYRVKFFRTAALVNQLVDAKADGTLEKFYQSLTKCDLLICDEWGYIPVDLEGAKLLYRVVAERYETKSIIITTNLEFGLWNGIFYDDKLTAAIVDRMVHHSHLLIFNAESHRVKNSLIKR